VVFGAPWDGMEEGEEMRKALIINPHRIDDLSDVLAIARAEGKKAFRTAENIRVPPEANLPRDELGNYIVVVELHSSPDAGESRQKK